MVRHLRFVLCFLIISILISSMIYADEKLSGMAISSQPDTIQKTAATGKPAVVFVLTIIRGKMTYPQQIERPSTNPITGKLEYSIIPSGSGLKMTEQVQNGMRGTGFIINSDGYIVTNAHVVQFEDEKELLKSAYLSKTKQMLSGFFENQDLSESEKEERVNVILQATDDYLNKYAEFKEIMKNIYVFNGVMTPEIDLTTKGLSADIIKVGGAYPDKDIAILKVNKNNLPILKLGDSRSINVGSKAFVIGYPGAADISIKSILEPSVTSGIVSALKKAEAGWDLIQTDATISPGSSGSPVFNEQGEVIGVATLSSELASGYGWVIPSDLIKDFLMEKNIVNAEATVDRYYKEALGFYWDKKYSKAIEKFRLVTDLYPEHPYAKEFIAESRAAIERGEEEVSLFNTKNLIIGGVILVSLLILILYMIVFREEKEIEKIEKDEEEIKRREYYMRYGGYQRR